MKRKGLAPLLLIPLVIIGLIAFYFLLKAIIGIVLQAVLWTVALTVVGLAGFVIYLIIRWVIRRKK